MKKRALWIAGLSLIAALIAGFSTYAAGVKPGEGPAWLVRIALAYRPYALVTGWAAAAALAIFQFLQAIFARPAFRRKAVQQTLDVLVERCSGSPRKNRVTVFKKAKGWQIICIGLWRLRGNYWSKEKRYKAAALLSLNWMWDYLYVYVRSSRGRRQASTAAFLISDDFPNAWSGVAGRVWEEGFLILPDLPRIQATDRSNARKLELNHILQQKGNDRLKRYVTATRIIDTKQLRSIETFARHFMGETIQVDGVGVWGVLLLDSEEDTCPFPATPDGGVFGELFRVQAKTLGNILS